MDKDNDNEQQGPVLRSKDRRMDLMGIPVSVLDGTEELHGVIRRMIAENRKGVVYNLNIHAVNLAMKYPWFKEFIRQARLVFCDGDGVRWGLRLLGYKPPVKIATTRWIWELAQFCEQEGFRLFLLGASPDILEQALQRLKSRYPRIQIAGHHGYFCKEGKENAAVIAGIQSFRPKILMVCFGMPLQEQWIYDNQDQLSCPVILKGGAVLDYVAGKLGAIPRWMLALNLEWLFRIFQEPGRLLGRYLYDIPCFFYYVAVAAFKNIIWHRSQTKPRE